MRTDKLRITETASTITEEKDTTGLEENRPVIGVYTFGNAGSVLIHEVDPWGEWVVASINGDTPKKYDIVEAETDDAQSDNDVESGFYMGEWFIPFSQVMRV